jgi:hypothetical protein
MADTPKKKTGLQPRTYVLIVGGSIGVYLIYRYLSDRSAAAAQTATSGGTTIPTDTTTGTSTAAPASLAAWIQTVLGGANYTSKYSNSNLYNDIQAWLNGNCVSAAGFTILGNAITTLGLPPGYASAPPLSVCPGASTPTPTTPAPTGTKGSTSPATTAAGVPSTATLEAILDQEVGVLSTLTGHNATAAQIQQWTAEAKAKGLSGFAAQFYIQSQNIGVAGTGLPNQNMGAIKALATQLAGGATSFARLPAAQQNQYIEIANVELLSQAHGK